MRLLSIVILVIPLLLSCSSDPLKPNDQTCEQFLFSNSSAGSNPITADASHESKFQKMIEQLAQPTSRFQVAVEKTHGLVLPGRIAQIDIYLTQGTPDIGGFNFLLAYDATFLSFQGATKGDALDHCEWEYFTYRSESDSNCEEFCPSGIIRLVAIAELNSNSTHPSPECSNIGTLATIDLLITNNCAVECQYIPIRFYWTDCGDNVITNIQGDSLFIANSVKEYPGDGINLMEYYPDAILPTFVGPMGCDTTSAPNVIANIEFINGGIDLVCADTIDHTGDLNLDGLGFTIEDAVMYSNYFIEGLTALVYVETPNQYGNIPGYEPSIYYSDVNADGVPLGVADLVYLIQVMVGNADPCIKPVGVYDLRLSQYSDGTLSTDLPIGAAAFTFEGELTPTLLATQMEMKYAQDTGYTKVLIWNIEGKAATGNILRINAPIVCMELASPEGLPASPTITSLEFAIEGVDPNPFSGSTVITFALPTQIDCDIWIYSINPCEIISEWHEVLGAGTHQLTWNASNLPPGEYVFRITANEITKQINMTLIE